MKNLWLQVCIVYFRSDSQLCPLNHTSLFVGSTVVFSLIHLTIQVKLQKTLYKTAILSFLLSYLYKVCQILIKFVEICLSHKAFENFILQTSENVLFSGTSPKHLFHLRIFNTYY